MVFVAGAFASFAGLPIREKGPVGVAVQSKYSILLVSPVVCVVLWDTELGEFFKCAEGKKLVTVKVNGVLPVFVIL